MTEEDFESNLKEIGCDDSQVQVAKNKVPTDHQLRGTYDALGIEYDDAKIEADFLEERRRIFDEYRQNGEEWERLHPSLRR